MRTFHKETNSSGRYKIVFVLVSRDVISVFSRGGANFDRLPRAGQNMKKTIFVCKNTKKSLFFKIRGANAPPLPPPK